MKLKVAALIAVFALSSSAFGASISGPITIAGLDTWSATGIAFNPDVGLVLAASGTLTPFQGATAGLTSFSFASSDGVILFGSPASSPFMDFVISGPVSVVSNTATFLNVTGFGTFNQFLFTPTFGSFSLTSTVNGNTSFTIDATPAATPEPNSLMLIGTGLLSGAGMIMRRSRTSV